jgi:hypothetical protein
MKIVTGWNLVGKGTRFFLTAVCSSSVHARRFWGHLLTRLRLADFSVRSALTLGHFLKISPFFAKNCHRAGGWGAARFFRAWDPHIFVT